jgi:predicted NUDIX family phosphoesterase
MLDTAAERYGIRRYGRKIQSKSADTHIAGLNFILIVLKYGEWFVGHFSVPARMEEHVLVVPTALFHQLGCFQGFCRSIDRYRDVLLAPKNVQFRPRSEVEKDPNYKQLIPYMIFCHTETEGTVRIFQYVRGKGMGESRLHHKRSIGIGGHLSAEDQTNDHNTDSQDVYRKGMLRELREEVVLQTTFTEHCVGLINDDNSEVGKVHLGIVHRFDVADPKIISNEPDLIESGFVTIGELQQNRPQLESWSAFCLDALFS